MEGPLVMNNLHAAIRVKEDSGLMILADDVFFHVIDMAQHDEDPMQFEQRCAGVFLSDDNYMYTLTNKNVQKNISSGFRLYDIENCINKAMKKNVKEKKGAEVDDFFEQLKGKDEV